MLWKDSFFTRIRVQGSFVVVTVTECASVERDERPKLHPSPREQRVIVSCVEMGGRRDGTIVINKIMSVPVSLSVCA